MLVTILIPTYNRGFFLDGLLRQLSESELFRKLEDIEIVVANNRSTDNTREVAERYQTALPNMRIVNHEAHVPSAEENIFRSFKYCNGEYTWALSDDDVPLLDNLPRVLEELKSSKPDFLVTNCPLISPKCSVVSHTTAKMHGESSTTDIVDLAERFGFWFMLAGISLQMVRTSIVQAYDFQPLLQINAIYSHVSAYLECFKGKKTVVLNSPLIWYVTRNDAGHWKNAAKRIGVFDEFFWTLGFIRQLKYLTGRGVVSPDMLGRTFDSDAHARWRVVFVITERLFRQVVRMRFKPSPRQMLSPAEFEEMCGAVQAAEPFYREVLRGLRELYARPRPWWRWLNPRGMLREVAMIRDVKNRVDHLRVFARSYLDMLYVRTHGQFYIYKVGSLFWAARGEHQQRLYEELEYIDATPLPNLLLRDKSLQGILSQLDLLTGQNQPQRLGTFSSATPPVHTFADGMRTVQRTDPARLGPMVGRLPMQLARKMARIARAYQNL
ncbi:MAG TPA: glycosyltransferase family 2 protein [Pirellulales bacterium]|jgi:glycosyltransferase involved in cell wall biosynthesis|nr:glycosyltransferase family 2 protein [Pirellulales bacterium]